MVYWLTEPSVAIFTARRRETEGRVLTSRRFPWQDVKMSRTTPRGKSHSAVQSTAASYRSERGRQYKKFKRLTTRTPRSIRPVSHDDGHTAPPDRALHPQGPPHHTTKSSVPRQPTKIPAARTPCQKPLEGVGVNGDRH